MYSPTHSYVRVSRVELVEVLDVPCVGHWNPTLRLQAGCTWPGDMGDLEGALPHGGELVKTLPREDPPEDEVPNLEGTRVWHPSS